MNHFLPFTKLEIITWLFTGLRAFLYSLIVTGTAALNVLKSTPWSAMSHDERIVFVIGLFIVQAGVMLAFLDSTIQKLLQASMPAQPISTNQTQK